MAITALIAAGGRGSRLGKLTQNTSKQLLPIGDECIICRLVRQLTETDLFDKIVIGTNGKFSKSFHELFPKDVFVHSTKDITRGPEETIFNLEKYVTSEYFVVVLGDSVFFNGFPKELVTSKHKNALCTMKLNNFDDSIKYAQLEVENDRITKVLGKTEVILSDIIQVPLYKFKTKKFFNTVKNLLKELEEGKEVTMTDILKEFIKSNDVYSVSIDDNSYIDVGTPNAYLKANKIIKSSQ